MSSKLTDLTAITSPDLADLLYLVANPGGSPLDRKVTMQDLLQLPFGAISVVGNSTGQTGIAGTTWTPVTQFATNVLSFGVTADQANDKLTFLTTGQYLCVFVMSFSGTANDTYNVRFLWNGVSDTGAQCTRKLGTGGDVGSATLMSIIDVTSVATDLQAEFQIDTSGDFTLEDGFLFALRLGST